MFDRLDATATQTQHGNSPASLSLRLRVLDPTFRSGPLLARFDSRNSWSYKDADRHLVARPGELGKADLARWLQDGGITIDTQARQSELDELFSLMQDMRQNISSSQVALAHLQATSRHVSTESQPRPLFLILQITIPVLVWIGGLVCIHLYLRKRKRDGMMKQKPHDPAITP